MRSVATSLGVLAVCGLLAACAGGNPPAGVDSVQDGLTQAQQGWTACQAGLATYQGGDHASGLAAMDAAMGRMAGALGTMQGGAGVMGRHGMMGACLDPVQSACSGMQGDLDRMRQAWQQMGGSDAAQQAAGAATMGDALDAMHQGLASADDGMAGFGYGTGMMGDAGMMGPDAGMGGGMH